MFPQSNMQVLARPQPQGAVQKVIIETHFSYREDPRYLSTEANV